MGPWAATGVGYGGSCVSRIRNGPRRMRRGVGVPALVSSAMLSPVTANPLITRSSNLAPVPRKHGEELPPSRVSRTFALMSTVVAGQVNL